MKEARKISKGENPTANVIHAANPTPCLISAAKAIIGAKAHKNHDTLFGLTFPVIVSIKYEAVPIKLSIKPKKMNLSSIMEPKVGIEPTV